MSSGTDRQQAELAVQRDAMHRACMLVAVLTGAVDRPAAIRAVGYLPGEIEADIDDCAQAGLSLVRAGQETGVPWRTLWEHHAQAYRTAKARAERAERADSPDRRVVLPSAARLKPRAFRPRSDA